MKKRDLSEAGKVGGGIEVRKLDGPPSAGASHTNATPASANNQINVTPLDNPTSAGSNGVVNVQATINTNNQTSENARANTDATSTGGGTGT